MIIRRLVLLFLCFSLLWSTGCSTEPPADFSSCYVHGVPTRCEPGPETFSLDIIPIVNSTCNDPPVEYCRRSGDGIDLICGQFCGTGDHPPEHMTDFFSPHLSDITWWQSASNLTQSVVIIIPLHTLVQVQAIRFEFMSFKPHSFYIRKKSSIGSPYTPYHYLSTDCLHRYGINPNPDLVPSNETAILCQQFTNSLPGQISFVPTLDRPSINDYVPGLSRQLYDFATATHIEITLDGYSLEATNISELYYALEDVSVVGKCQCNGHANTCITESNGRRCVCQHNTTGDNCEQCADMYIDVPWDISNGGAPFECISCNCSGNALSCEFDSVLYAATGSGGRCLNCTNNTAGPHCEECADGYTFNGTSCVPCQCNRLADICNKDTGSCINCIGNSIGTNCQYCIDGYYGDPTMNISCLPCSCPLTSTPGQYSTICELAQGGGANCTNCTEGHVGIQCERCSPGYYGDPIGEKTGNSTRCLPCSCNGNIYENNSSGCHNVTGECNCLFNTMGDECQYCKEGYYGDPIHAKNCTDCSCNINGSLLNDVTCLDGQCNCLPNVMGLKCDECILNHYNFSSGVGCQSCDCHVNGSYNNSCDLYSGDCTCKTGVIDQKCDSCQEGFYGLDTNGCKVCNCNVHASSCVSDPINDYLCIDCADNTTGPYCEQCNVTYYPQLHLPVNSSDYCQSCNCNANGTTDNGDCSRNVSSLGQCYCKLNVQGRDCSVCKDGYYNLTASNPTGCQDCSCHGNLSLSPDCDNDGVCTCVPNANGERCNECAPGYYYTNYTCSLCNCHLGGALTNECDSNGQCTCRTGITGQTCSQVAPGYYSPFIDHYTFEAEDNLGIFNLSYRLPISPDLFTGAGYASIRNKVDIINFGTFTPPINGLYDLAIRYSLMGPFMWQAAHLRISVGNEPGYNSPESCQEYESSMGDIPYSNWTIGMGQAVVKPVCLRGGRSYDFVLNGFQFGQASELEVDSLVILLNRGDNLKTLNYTHIKTQYDNCLNSFKRLATRTNSSLANCREVSFTVYSELFNGTLECNCDDDGSYNSSQCDPYGGQCACKPNVIGRACDVCAGGSYGHSSVGCTTCGCHGDGSDSVFCNRIIGQCNCLANVERRTCDMCSPDHFNISSRMGCMECGCDVDGSMDSQCHVTNGICTCHDAITGDKCDRCEDYYYGFPNCRECNCSLSGSLENDIDCNSVSGQCSCRNNTKGQSCDMCLDGTFNLNASNPNGCQPCYCSGQATDCTIANDHVSMPISTDFTGGDNADWSVSANATLQQGGVVIADATAYLIAPSKFLGNRLSSYVQFIRINVSIDGVPVSSPLTPDVIIMNSDQQLYGYYKESLVPGQQILTIHLHESSAWTTPSGDTIYAADMQNILLSLTGLYLRASLSNTVTTFHSISLDSTSTGVGIGVGWVEQCTCPSAAYTGLSCEECADGYTFNGTSCVPCQCNRLADICNKDTGSCINCIGNSLGTNCQYCIDGYYGDPTMNISCLPCSCPLTSTPGQYSTICELAQGGGANCTNCTEGHVGIQCERCSPGYYGDPTGEKTGNSTRCRTCMCNGNIDLDDTESCNMTNGLCDKCLFNTTGDECQYCEEGYYGDPIYAKNCTDCSCNITGSLLNDVTCLGGQCNCLPNVMGLKCDECILNHYNFSSGVGCQSCDCHVNGSYNNSCDLYSGDCTCKTGVIDQKCDSCQEGFYGLDTNGCKDCNCSVGSITPQCYSNGSCPCKPGVLGSKCDLCLENFFQNTSTGLCTNCPICYDYLKGDVDMIRTHYNSTRVTVNDVAEMNDPSTTFDEKQKYALKITNELYRKVLLLNATYTNFTDDFEKVSDRIEPLPGIVTDIETLLRMLRIKASPLINFALVSEEVVNQTKKELYKSISLLYKMNETILPQVTGYANTIESDAAIGEEMRDTSLAYVQRLQAELYNLTLLASIAIDQANTSLTSAWSALSVYNSTRNELSVLEDIISTLTNMNDIVKSNLSELQQQVLAKRAALTMTSDLLMILDIPSKELIDSLLMDVQHLQREEQSLRNISMLQTQLFNNLQSNLTYFSNRFNLLCAQLNQTIQSIDWYYQQLSNSYNDTLAAQLSSEECIATGNRVLSQLVSFNSTITGLRASADSVAITVSLIEEDVKTVQESVENVTNLLQDITSRLSQALPLARQASENSNILYMNAIKLYDNSTLLSMQAQSLSDDILSALNDTQPLLDASDDTLADINSLEEDVNMVSNLLQQPPISQLASNAAVLSTNASDSIASLTDLFLATPSPDASLISDVESYINSVATQLNTTDIEALTQYFEEQLSGPLDTELTALKIELASIEDKVTRIRTILDSLPVDCTS